mgnify:CR=1 FL=1
MTDYNKDTVYHKMLMASKEGEDGVDIIQNHNGDCLKRITFSNDLEKDRYFEQDHYSWPHASPGSVYIVAVGNRWKRDEKKGIDCEQLVKDMCIYTQKRGYKVSFEEFPVWFGAFPNPSVASAREHGAMNAIKSGLQFTFFIDNDAMPEPNLLVDLIEFNVPMITPMVMDSKSGEMLGGPFREKNSGVYNQKWASMSALLIKTSLLQLPGVKFVDSDTEGIFYERFAIWEHTVHIDTSSILHTLTPPTRPDSMSYEARVAMNKERYSHIFEKRVPMDAIAQELFDEKEEIGEDQVKTIKM